MNRRRNVPYSAFAAIMAAVVLGPGGAPGWPGDVHAAHAGPATVAIVNLASDQPAGAAQSKQLRWNLGASKDFVPLAQGELARSLEQPLAPWLDDRARLAQAREALGRADEALARLDYERCLRELADAEAVLLTLEPQPAVWHLLADIAFARGDILLREGRQAAAMAELVVVKSLDPHRPTPDPQRHRPEVTHAYQVAAAAAPSASLRVLAPFDGAVIYIDGRRVGETPFTAPVSPGVHYVIGAHPNNFVTGKRVVVEPRGTSTVSLHFEVITVEDRARFIRRQLLAGPLITELPARILAEAAQRVAELTSSDKVLLVAQNRQGALLTAWYDGHQRTMEPWQEAAVLVESLLLPQSVRRSMPPAIVPAPQPPGPEEWWKQPWARAGFAGMAIAAITGIALYSLTSESPPVTLDGSVCCVVISSPPSGASTR